MINTQEKNSLCAGGDGPFTGNFQGRLFRISGKNRFVAVILGNIHNPHHIFDGDGFFCLDIDTGIIRIL